MQVGIIAYTRSDGVPAAPDDPARENTSVLKDAPVDMTLEVDWVRFDRPKVPPVNDWYGRVNGTNELTNPNLTQEPILEALGT